MLRATDDHRRARIARRHGLHPDHRYDTIEATTAGMTALHATEVSTPYLSLHARMVHLTPDDVDAALYDDRSIVRTMAMRRTLWIVTRDLLPAVSGSAGRRVADEQRRLLAKETADLEAESGADWIADAARRVVDTLTGRELSARQLRERTPRPRRDVHGRTGHEVVDRSTRDESPPHDAHGVRRRRAGPQRRPLAKVAPAVDVDGGLARRGPRADHAGGRVCSARRDGCCGRSGRRPRTTSCGGSARRRVPSAARWPRSRRSA